MFCISALFADAISANSVFWGEDSLLPPHFSMFFVVVVGEKGAKKELSKLDNCKKKGGHAKSSVLLV